MKKKCIVYKLQPQDSSSMIKMWLLWEALMLHLCCGMWLMINKSFTGSLSLLQMWLWKTKCLLVVCKWEKSDITTVLKMFQCNTYSSCMVKRFVITETLVVKKHTGISQFAKQQKMDVVKSVNVDISCDRLFYEI
ncbi:Protein of unknown function [Gryllus bimaculatus]|nr:Protein of unknown function [Gryllus bimaculatus]